MNFNEHIKRELINEYAGSERKKTVLLDDGNKYLLKFPDPTREKAKEISYINNSISEYIGCKIVKSLGLPVQEVVLGEYTDERGKTKIACACKDVREPGEIMHPVQTVNLSSLDDETKNDVSLKNAMNFAERLQLIPAAEIKEFYYNMFVADAFLGNTDRHNGNWAVLTDMQGNARMSPIYDCGSSLSPLLSDDELDYRHLSSDALNTFSIIVDENQRRINYKDYLLSCKNEDLNAAAKRIIGRINLKNINSFIDDIPYITNKRKSFYKDILKMRYEKILIPTLEKLFQREREDISIYTEELTADNLKYFSANVMEKVRRAENYSLVTLKDKQSNEFFHFRKVNQKYAIIFDQEQNITGVAPIKKDYQDVKSFIFELGQVIDMDKDYYFVPPETENSIDRTTARSYRSIDDEYER